MSGPGSSEARKRQNVRWTGPCVGPEPAGPRCAGPGSPMGDLEEISNQKRGKTLWILDPSIEYHTGRKSYHEISAKA